jgi:hypothetical protein
VGDKTLRLFPGVVTKDHQADVMLQLAAGELDEVVILGWDKRGELFFSSNVADGGTVLWLLEKAKRMLLEIGSD